MKKKIRNKIRRRKIDMKQKIIKEISTSIVCPLELLESNENLEFILRKRENRYFLVTGTNSVIMHVEEDCCVLINYMIHTHNSENKEKLPVILSVRHFGVYKDKKRDWIKDTATSEILGHIIQKIVYGNAVEDYKKQGMTVDHGAETWNEKIENCMYKKNNWNNGSHRIPVRIRNQKQLNNLIYRIKQMDGKKGYLYPKNKK